MRGNYRLFLMVFVASVCMYGQIAFAACSPGIPCMTYEAGKGANNDKIASYGATCDGDVMNQIYARAVLEAQRENVFNKMHIRKPDSVLEYSCFDEYVNVAASEAPKLFSETERWKGVGYELSVEGFPADKYPKTRPFDVYMGKEHIIKPLQNTVMTPMKNYLEDNFNNQDELVGSADGVNLIRSDTVSPKSQITCSRMKQVWDIAKCINFDKEEDFKSFKELFEDPRQKFHDCQAVMAPIRAEAGITEDTYRISQAMLDIANNPAPAYPTYTGAVTEPYQYALFDGMRHVKEGEEKRYSDPKLKPAPAAIGEDQCAPPIFTGLQTKYRRFASAAVARLAELRPVYDAICPNPGCYYEITVSPSEDSSDGFTRTTAPAGGTTGAGGVLKGICVPVKTE